MGTLATGLKLKRRKLKLDLGLGSTPEAKTKKAEPFTKTVERPLTKAEVIYTDMAAVQPLVETLVAKLDLRDQRTGKTPRKGVAKPVEEIRAQINASKSISKTLAELILPPLSNEHRPELKRRIMAETGATPEQAETKLQELIDTEQILETLGKSFYLKGSTPF